MKLTEVITPSEIILNLNSTSRDDAIGELVDILVKDKDTVCNAPELKEAMLRREHLGSTAIGRSVAIPHARCECSTKFLGALGLSQDGIEFAAIDNKPVHIVFLLASPPDSQRAHLKMLAHISRVVSRSEVQKEIMAAKTPEEVHEILANAEV